MLNYFNNALVDHFQPELSPKYFKDYSRWSATHEVVQSVRQIEEFKKALLFAENKILPHFDSSNLNTISPPILEKWVKIFHKIACDTLSKNHNIIAGNYRADILITWRPNTNFGYDFKKLIMEADFQNNLWQIKMAMLFKYYKIKELAEPWINLMTRASIVNVIIKQEDNHNLFEELMYVIMSAHHNNQIDPLELDAFNQVCSYVLFDINKLNKFYEKLSHAITRCDGRYINVIDIMANAYQDFLKLSPFATGNEVIAMLLINMISVGFKQPSIILSTVEERENPKSAFNQLICADKPPTLDVLKNYFHSAIRSSVHQAGTGNSKPMPKNPSILLSDEIARVANNFQELLDKVDKFNIERNIDKEQVKTNHIGLNILYNLTMQKVGNKFGLDAILNADLLNEMDDYCFRLSLKP